MGPAGLARRGAHMLPQGVEEPSGESLFFYGYKRKLYLSLTFTPQEMATLILLPMKNSSLLLDLILYVQQDEYAQM